MILAYIVGEFPSYSECFIHSEINDLRSSGFKIIIYSRKKGPVLSVRRFKETDIVIYDKPFLSQSKLIAHLYFIRTGSQVYFKVVQQLLQTERSVKSLCKAIRNFSTSIWFLYMSRKEPIEQLHAHFLSMPTDIAIIMSALSGIPFSCSAHAHDVFTTPSKELKEKIEKSVFTVTCTQYNANLLEGIVSGIHKLKIRQVYHGIDLREWAAKRISNYKSDNLQILSVCRLVEKKGIIYVLESINILKKRGYSIRYLLVGEGPLRGYFEKYIQIHQLQENVTLYGALERDEVKRLYYSSDIFVLPCVETVNGDKDGLPNVLFEAMAVGLPIISTNVSAVSELIKPGETGLLIPQRDSQAIADAVITLKDDRGLFQSLIINGQEMIKNFDSGLSSRKLTELFKNSERRN